ncbi:hypothetical protein M758_5G111100 [Ceratodon purpureus]|nr:hypothetical protein M758_5G111100 [Ceratodon purpureus]
MLSFCSISIFLIILVQISGIQCYDHFLGFLTMQFQHLGALKSMDLYVFRIGCFIPIPCYGLQCLLYCFSLLFA